MKNVPRGSAVEGASINTPTATWGGGDGNAAGGEGDDVMYGGADDDYMSGDGDDDEMVWSLTTHGETVTAHCANPGSMMGLAEPDSTVWLSPSDNPKRKLPCTLEMIRVGRIWVGLHTLRANQLVARALHARAIPGLRRHGFPLAHGLVVVTYGVGVEAALVVSVNGNWKKQQKNL